MMISPRILQIESWRRIPHSYSIVNQFQCLQFLREPNLALRHLDVPFFNPNWRRATGLFPTDMETAIAGISPPVPGEVPDAILRISYPHDIRPSVAKRTVVFGTSEFRCMPRRNIAGGRSLAEAMQSCDAQIITPSNWSREGFIQSGADPRRVTVVPHGVEPAIFHPVEPAEKEKLRSQVGWNGFVFLTLGSMTANKGMVQLLKAFAVVAQKHPQVRLVAKGIGTLYPSKNLLASYTGQLSEAEMAIINPRLNYIDRTFSFSDMARLYQSVDAYVSPYTAEGFNMPVLEAIASGLPVICTAGGSTDDFTTGEFALRINSTLEAIQPAPDTNGFALKVNFEHLVQLMLAAVESSSLATRARIAGPAFVSRGFTWGHVKDRLLAVLFD